MTAPTVVELITAKITPSALRCAFAYQQIAEAGHTPTVEGIMRLLDLSKSSVYSAQAELNDRVPHWREALSGNGHVAIPETRTQSENLDTLPGTAVEPAYTPPPAPLWAAALTRAVEGTIGHKSWDLYATYGQAWETITHAPIEDARMVGECIALTGNYIETLRGEELTGPERTSVAMLVRQFGKAALYGFSQALGATNEHNMRDWLVYGRRVAQSQVERFRRKG